MGLDWREARDVLALLEEAKKTQSVHELVDDPKMGCKSVWLFFCREGRLSECKQASKRETESELCKAVSQSETGLQVAGSQHDGPVGSKRGFSWKNPLAPPGCPSPTTRSTHSPGRASSNFYSETPRLLNESCVTKG